MPSHGAAYYHGGNNPHQTRRRSHRRSSDAATAGTRLYTADESAKILEASREALKTAQRRHARRHSGGYYYTIPRTDTPEIPSYEHFLAEARARVNNTTSYYPQDTITNTHYDPYQYQFNPNPYLYGYPSGYYQEIRAPLHHTDSARTGKSGVSSTLVGSETTYSPTSPTLVGSGRPSLEQPQSLRTVQPTRNSYPGRTSHSNRTSHPNRASHSNRSSYPRRQTRVSWGPTYTCVDPPHTYRYPRTTKPTRSRTPQPVRRPRQKRTSWFCWCW
ncbi:hypothetical protein, variant [Verruconis gallopava]|uniref:Uncharacterized protein n=1 Tax=Verruconis gallopava TaxID=253628 RepID=A0A0D2ANQ0_9PEZI|nr:uncharacterized protein PV09_01261 [Verruconis gallopava]XP_016218213.1 hypothetical protein, variant [Verruconis gallopava]KIW08343.1 hypothetical protein PV09_01261 [Verruconis gallopava]KIW08344.1 hypothetical protein, variant [Verruconis gallopava]